MFKQKTLYFFLCLTFLWAQFDWIDDGAPIRQGLHIEWQRTADASGTGEIIFAWSDTRESIRDIFAQKVDANGNKLWGESGIAVAQTYGRQEDPLLVSDEAGGAFIVWIDYRDEIDTQGDIYAQHILSDGSLVWDVSGQPIVVQEGAQRYPNICMDGEGGAYIIWRDIIDSSQDHIYASHINSNNEVINPGLGIAIATNSDHHNKISLETAGNGDAAMVWVDDRNPDLDIYGQRISADHTNNTISTLWSTVEEGGRVICDEEGEQNSAKITYAVGCCGDDMGITAVTWEDQRSGTDWDVYMQYLYLNGDPYFDSSGLLLTGSENDDKNPRVKADNSGAYVVWYQNNDIYGQKIIFSQDDPIQWADNGRAISFEDTNQVTQSQVRLSTDGQGGAYFIFEDSRDDDLNNKDIYIQHVDPNNEFTYNDGGKAVVSVLGDQEMPIVRNDGDGGAFVVWYDKREGSGSLYVQHLGYMSDITFEENGKFILYGKEGDTEEMQSEYLGSGQSIVYFEDWEPGYASTKGKVISSGYGDSYDGAFNAGVKILSENISQNLPKAKALGSDKLFYGFYQNNWDAQVDPFEGYNQMFQLLDLPDLNLIGDSNGTWLFESDNYQYSFIADNQLAMELSSNDEGGVFYFTSLSEFFAGIDVYVHKVGSDGSIVWDAPINVTNNMLYDNRIIKAVPNSDGGSIFVYTEQATSSVNYISSIDQDGNIIDGFPKRICDIDSFQIISDVINTENGIFIVWTDDRNVYEYDDEGYAISDSDIYGQFFDHGGNRLGPDEGIVLVANTDKQDGTRVAFNYDLNEAMICFENYQGTGEEGDAINTDIFCNIIDLSTLEVSAGLDGDPLYKVTTGVAESHSPDLDYAINGNYMVVWVDSRYDDDLNTGTHTDIYYQEIGSDGFVYQNEGIPVCLAYHIQTDPQIVLYSEGDNHESRLIYWQDYRSTGKDILKNIYGQSITHEVELSSDKNTSKEFSLNSIYPNPFNPSVNINFFHPGNSRISIHVYDLNGRLVENIYDDNLNYGNHNFTWNAQKYSSGIYMVSLKSDNKHITSKISLIK